MDLEDLQRAITANSAATQQLKGVEEKYSRADALRNSQGPTPDQFGQTSVLGHLATVLGQSQGRQGVREQGPLRETLRAQIGKGEGELAGQTLKMAMTKANEQTEAHQLTQATNKEGGETWTDGKNEIAVVHNEKRQPVQLDGTPVPEGFVPKERGYGSGGASRGKAYSQKDVDSIAEQANIVSNVGEIAGNFNDSYAQPTNLPTGFTNRLALSASRNDILGLIDKDMDVRTKEAAQWWADWRMFYTLPKRNKAFGATLTKPEAKSWDEAENVQPGMAASEIRIRVQRLREIAEKNLLKKANMGLVNPLESNRAVWQRGVGDLFEYDEDRNEFHFGASREQIPNPSGIADWDDWSQEERQLWLEEHPQ